MNREIKFRGKCKHSGKWAYGTYHYSLDLKHHYIINREKLIENGDYTEYKLYSEEVADVDPNTVGEYAGLRDIAENGIYEGDILSDKWRVEVSRHKNNGLFIVTFHTNPSFNKMRTLYEYLKDRQLAGTGKKDNIIIGNIYENPELLK